MLVIFKSVPQGYELLVCNSIFEATQIWLTTQGCVFQNTYEKGYTRILITEIPAETLARLQQKFPVNETIYQAVDKLRHGLADQNWPAILTLTEDWTDQFKYESWSYLSDEEKQELRYLSLKHAEKQDFEEKLQFFDRDILLRMIAILKAAGLTAFKPLNKTTNLVLVDKLMEFFDRQEVCLRAALLLATATQQQHDAP